uniref:Transmembrane protein n=1 Tax=Sparus aurata TaxID=8175 RepID=A0A671V8U6_SPAAU
MSHDVHVSYLRRLFFRRASRRFFVFLFSLLLVLACGFSLVCFLTKSFRSVRFTIAVARRVSLSALGFLCSFSIFLKVSSSPLKDFKNK